MVSVDELVRGVNIALGNTPLTDCPSFDRDDSHTVSVDELVLAVNAALNGCPPEPTPSATRTPSSPPTATPTNAPPIIGSSDVYRTYPGFGIRLPLNAHDPEGGPLQFTAMDLPDGAQLDAGTGVLTWTPGTDQLGPFVVDFTATDSGTPPLSADGVQSFVVSPLDECTSPTCSAASGCDSQLVSLDTTCCENGPGQRVDEPPPSCPGGRVVFAGRNSVDDSSGQPVLTNGFGRLVDCDQLRVASGSQGGGVLFLNVEARCLNLSGPVRIQVRLEAPGLLVVDQIAQVVTPLDPADGYARWQVRFPVGAAPPPDTESNLTLSITDSDGLKLIQQLRVISTPDVLPDLPD
ncbi:MAG TPA: Ig-like domain-containing protein [Candidatus Kryptonia bacterium]|nr:Ig-like domain-containing protein [Candidatus Kryptonia bacterium]